MKKIRLDGEPVDPASTSSLKYRVRQSIGVLNRWTNEIEKIVPESIFI